MVQTVQVVAGTETPIGEGLNKAFRCVVRYPDATTRAAIVKSLPPNAVAAEAFCALLLRGWGLSVPEPALVPGPPLSFACVELPYPNLKQRIGWSLALPRIVREVLEREGAKLVASFRDTPLALAADEAINNRDRHLGNILWDGSSVAWIDHDQSFGMGAAQDLNKLAVLAVMSGDYSKVQKAAVAIALTLGGVAVKEAEEACGSMPEAPQFATHVSNRLGALAAMVLKRFPSPPDLLTENPGDGNEG